MDKYVYYRGKTGTCWYNFTESLAYLITYRPTPEGITYTKRIPYGSERQQFINTYCRNDLKDVKKPLFIYIHGGGWISGITDMRNTYIQNYAKLGFYTASIAYTYAPEKIFPAPLQEICNAVDYLFDHAEEEKYDTSEILISGESAGGYYIFFLAALAGDKSLAGKLGLTFRHNEEFSIKAMISHCGCVNLKKLLDPNCPQSRFPDMKMMVTSLLGMKYDKARAFLETDEGYMTYPHVTDKFPPTFFTTAAGDWLRYEGYDLMKEYKALGIPYDTYEGTGILRNHAWTIVTIVKKGRECLDKTLDFVLPYIEKYEFDRQEK